MAEQLSSIPLLQVSSCINCVCSKLLLTHVKLLKSIGKLCLRRGNFDNQCLWNIHKNKPNPIKCSTITGLQPLWPLDKGGLRIPLVSATNFSLFLKWLWRYHNEPNALWKTFIDVKYTKTSMDGIPTNAKYNRFNTFWRSIRKGLDWFKTQMR